MVQTSEQNTAPLEFYKTPTWCLASRATRGTSPHLWSTSGVGNATSNATASLGKTTTLNLILTSTAPNHPLMDLGASRFFFHPLPFLKDPSFWQRQFEVGKLVHGLQRHSPQRFLICLASIQKPKVLHLENSIAYTCDRNNMRLEIQKLNYVPSWFLVVCNLESLEWGDSAHQMLFGHHTSWKLQPAASRRKAKRSLAWKVLGEVAPVHVVWEPGNVRWCSAGPNWCLDWTNLLHFAGKIHKVSFYVSYMCVPLRMYQWIVLFPGPYVMHGSAPRHIGM